MVNAPSFDALGVLGPPQVAAAHGRARPVVLALELAGVAAGGLRTITLMPQVAVIRFVQLAALAAFASSPSRHELLRYRSAHHPLSAPACGKKTQRNEHGNSEEDDYFLSFEEYGFEEDTEEDGYFHTGGIATVSDRC
jgi:hypothetical protein